VSVLFDIQALQSPAHADRGVARYVRELAHALDERDPNAVSAFLLNPDMPAPKALQVFGSSQKIGSNSAIEQYEASIYHIGSPFEPAPRIDGIWPRAAQRSMRLVVTLFDLIPLLFPQIYLTDPRTRLWYHTRLELIRRADRVLAISETTAADAVERLRLSPERVTVVGAGVSQHFKRPASRDEAFDALHARRRDIARGFILFTGGIEPRKNIDRLLEAYATLDNGVRRAHQLVVVCSVSAEERVSLDGKLRGLGISQDVMFPGYVPEEDLVLLYQAAELFIFPSLYEGFGLPVAEAIACGTPVVAARSSSLTELVDDPQALFDPRSTSEIRNTIERALRDDELRARLGEKRLEPRHSWAEVAARTAGVYENLLRRPRRRRPRQRLAYFSPLPPLRSGVADESYRLTQALSDHYAVDAFVDASGAEVDRPPGVSVLSIDWFERAERARGGYDRLFYCLGNSEHHAKSLALLRRRPGSVLAHDVRLTALWAWTAHHKPELVNHQSFDQLVREVYGARLPQNAAEIAIDPHAADRYGVFMAREAIACSEYFFVHSEHAAQLALLDADPADASKIVVIPFGVVDPEEFEPRPDLSQPLIASFGIASPAKQIDKTLATFVELGHRNPALRFGIVGPIEGDVRERCEHAAAELLRSQRLTITGEVTEREFVTWIERAAVAIQLRELSNGETSGTVARCLAARVPTIVTALGSARELPDCAVVKVDRFIEPRALANAVEALLLNEAGRQNLQAEGVKYARASSFKRVVETLVEHLELAGPSTRRAA
jgi:glycosyltransferase involved in cell wall biosynthesis